MMKMILFLLLFSLAFGQVGKVKRKSDRELAGYVGPVKQVLEEWTPIEKPRHYIQPGTRCRNHATVYDEQGREIQSSSFSNSCGTDENRNTYTYDAEGNYTIRYESFHDPKSPPPPPPPMIPPGAKPRATGPPKAVFKYDAQGHKIEKTVINSNGDLLYRVMWEWDDKDRMKEQQSFDANGTLTGRSIRRYEGQQRHPLESTIYGRDGKIIFKATYSAYKLNAQGDWIERKEAWEEIGQSPGSTLAFRTIKYYEK
ncbi:MAG: hypothetical protein JST84_10520 [Acidobacteria bacterium]|nr:hypothetical protein [Acidobacteriota bacterium]